MPVLFHADPDARLLEPIQTWNPPRLSEPSPRFHICPPRITRTDRRSTPHHDPVLDAEIHPAVTLEYIAPSAAKAAM